MPTGPLGSEPAECGAGSNDPEQAGATPARTAKLYAVARADLPPGLRTAQVGHALIAWVLAHGAPPDNLVVLQVPHEGELLQYDHELQRAGIRTVLFREPDLDEEPTALVVGPEGWRRLSSLPLL